MTAFSDIPAFYIILPLVAFLYASVGHGGASGYLALMIIFSFPENEMKSTALVLNIVASSISFFSYFREKYFDWKLFTAVAALAIPCAFIGGMIETDDQIFKYLLGVFLIFAITRMLGLFDSKNKSIDTLVKPNFYLAGGIGMVIGFLSGLLGIGGGILLTPVLLLFRWTSVKVAAGISALFILVNSLSGLAGQIKADKLVLGDQLPVMIIIVLAGALAGGYLGSKKFNTKVLRYILASVLLIATYKLFFN
ncbi:MAG: sulfite exporter TauE/SafE family protein [Crocinitomicaceae bacterium]|nr:sulfite exporter TauE/SafE family protein [Crocinitomicaceae bacterium]